jgi:hypothetical protein
MHAATPLLSLALLLLICRGHRGALCQLLLLLLICTSHLTALFNLLLLLLLHFQLARQLPEAVVLRRCQTLAPVAPAPHIYLGPGQLTFLAGNKDYQLGQTTTCRQSVTNIVQHSRPRPGKWHIPFESMPSLTTVGRCTAPTIC